METTLTTTRNGYGFGHDWTLTLTTGNGTKVFYLGQDIKFCRRVLGMEPSDIVEEIGDNNLSNPETLNKLCNLIIERLTLTDEIVDGLEPWELCCQ